MCRTIKHSMPKGNKCSQKARECEAIKQGEITLAICTNTKEISANPTYEDSGDDFDNSASEDFEMGPVVAGTSSTFPDDDVMDLDWTGNNVGLLLNLLCDKPR